MPQQAEVDHACRQLQGWHHRRTWGTQDDVLAEQQLREAASLGCAADSLSIGYCATSGALTTATGPAPQPRTSQHGCHPSHSHGQGGCRAHSRSQSQSDGHSHPQGAASLAQWGSVVERAPDEARAFGDLSNLDDLHQGLTDGELLVVVQRLSREEATSGGSTPCSQPGDANTCSVSRATKVSMLALQGSRTRPGSAGVPALDLSKLKASANAALFTKNLPPEEGDEGWASSGGGDPIPSAKEGSDEGVAPIHKDAPVVDNRCYMYKAVSQQEVFAMRTLLGRLPEGEARQVAVLWDALLVARHDCEAMAARGVRVSRDVSRDWQETVSDLIDRVVVQDTEIARLKQQLNMAPQAQVCVDELQSQLVRLKRQRDKQARELEEMCGTLRDAQEQAAARRQEAAKAQESLAAVRGKARALVEQHASLLSQHMELAAYASHLECELALGRRGADSDVAGGAGIATVGELAGAVLGAHPQHAIRLSSPRAARSPRGTGGRSPCPGSAASFAPGSLSVGSKFALASVRGGAGDDVFVSGSSNSRIALDLAEMLGAGLQDQEHASDSREVDQFDQSGQQLLSRSPAASPVMMMGKSRLMARTVAGSALPAGGLDLGGEIEACKQQRNQLVAIGI